jgi:quinone-modifying oxidoreductase, subunit QmoA
MNAAAKQGSSLLVVGAGIAGISAALEAAEAGNEVVLVERDPWVGGRVLRLNHYFPKLCPPSCGMEINTRRIEHNPRITVFTNTTVKSAVKFDSGWSVTLAEAPLYVNDRCTACGECSKACPEKVKNPHNLDMDEMPAIGYPHPDVWPAKVAMTRSACPDGCDKCVAACKYGAINLSAEPREIVVETGAMVVATGWTPYPLANLPELGGDLTDVISNVQMERLAAPSGPTGGKIVKADGEAPKKVAFVQCAGSRDVNHLPYCSGVCCMASLKQAEYVLEQLPEAEVTFYYIDRRTPGRNEDMLTKALAKEGLNLVKGKVGAIVQNGDMLKLNVEDAMTAKLLEAEADLVVLATGMVPNLKLDALPLDLSLDDDGFGLDNIENGLVVAGVSRRPEDVAASVRDATGAAAKALVAAARRA